ncbi:MAG: radical SAM protein [Pseudomonadota bacterium]
MAQQLDLLLIRPGDQKEVYGTLSSSLAAIEPPLFAGLIAAFAREKGYSVKIIDADAEDIGPDETAERAAALNPRLVVFIVVGNNLSASTWLMTGAGLFHAALKDKAPQIKTMFWGLHASSLPEQTLREERSDFVCHGEGFYTITDLLAQLKKEPGARDLAIPGLWYLEGEKLVANSRSPVLQDLDQLPPVAWDLLPMEKYRAHNWHTFFGLLPRQPYGVIYASLGCPFNCSFCALKTLFKGKPSIRYRSPNKVIEDIDVLVNKYKVKSIKMLDECFGLREKHVVEICDLIISRGYDLNIWAYARIDTITPGMLAKMKQAGINWLCYGIESGSKKALNGVSKGKYGSDEVRQVIKMTRDAGINILANFMVGLPDDDLESMNDTLELAKELNCEYTNIYATMAYPGSELYAEAKANNIPLPDVWRGYAAFSTECLPLPTKHLSSAEVLRFRDEAFVAFHSSPKYLEMMGQKFGQVTVDNIKKMLGHKLERKILAKTEARS